MHPEVSPACTLIAFVADAPIHVSYELVDQRQTQALPVLLARYERLEDVLSQGWVYPRTIVADNYRDFRVLTLHRDPDSGRAVPRFVFERSALQSEHVTGRDLSSRLRYEAQDLAQDLRRQARLSRAGSDRAIRQTDQVMDEIETLATDLDILLAEKNGTGVA